MCEWTFRLKVSPNLMGASQICTCCYYYSHDRIWVVTTFRDVHDLSEMTAENFAHINLIVVVSSRKNCRSIQTSRREGKIKLFVCPIIVVNHSLKKKCWICRIKIIIWIVYRQFLGHLMSVVSHWEQ